MIFNALAPIMRAQEATKNIALNVTVLLKSIYSHRLNTPSANGKLAMPNSVDSVTSPAT